MAKPQATVEPKFEDLDLYTEWVHEVGHDTLIAYLPGFRKEQLKVQLTSTGKLRLTGERQVSENKWSRFRKEFLIPPNCDVNQVNANFKGGMLHVKLPKLITPMPAPSQADSPQNKQKPTTTAPTTTSNPLQEKGKHAPTTDQSLQEKQKPAPPTAAGPGQAKGKPAPMTGAVPTPPPGSTTTTTSQTPKNDLYTQEPKPVAPKPVLGKTEQPMRPPATEPQKQLTGQDKPSEKEKIAKEEKTIVDPEKALKKEEKPNLVEGESSKNRAESKTDPAEKLEACSIAAARTKLIGRKISDQTKVIGSEISEMFGVYKEAVGDIVTDLTRDRKKMMAAMTVVLVAAAVGFLARRAFESSDSSQ